MRPDSEHARRWFLDYAEQHEYLQPRFDFACYARPTEKAAVVFRSMPHGTALFFDQGMAFLTKARHGGTARMAGQVGARVLSQLALLPLDGLLEAGGDLIVDAAGKLHGRDLALERLLASPCSLFMPYAAITSVQAKGGVMSAQGQKIIIRSGGDPMVLLNSDDVTFRKKRRAIVAFVEARMGR